MNEFKRAIVSVLRNKVKNILFFLLIVGLGTLMASMLVLNQSINQMSDNLWRQFPPIVVVDFNIEGDFRGERELLTADFLAPVVNLPYVSNFDIFNGTPIYSRELERVTIDNEWDQLSLENYPVVMIELDGITNPNVMRIETGVYDLVEGRSFTESEMTPANPQESVTMISRSFADLNGLNVGDTVVFENNFYKHYLTEYWQYGDQYPDEHIVDYELYTLEIIGIFEPIVIPDFGGVRGELDLLFMEKHINNGFIVPLPVVHSVMDFVAQQQHESNSEFMFAEDAMQRNIILLHDAADLPAFIEAAENILPSYYKIGTFSNSALAVQRFDESMAPFRQFGSHGIWFVMGAMLLSLSLAVTLYLRDRKHEIGVYLALGEKKIKVIKQLIIELLLPVVSGLVVALFLGNTVAHFIGHEMLVSDLIASQDFNFDDYGRSEAGALLQWYMDDSIEITIENYDLSLEEETVVLFFAISMVMTLMAILLPISYFMRRPPNEGLTSYQ